MENWFPLSNTENYDFYFELEQLSDLSDYYHLPFFIVVFIYEIFLTYQLPRFEKYLKIGWLGLQGKKCQ